MARDQVRLVSTAKKVAKAKPPVAVTLLDKSGKRVNDRWSFLADDQPASEGAAVVVSVKRLQNEGEALLKRGPVGVKVLPSEAIEEIAAYIPEMTLIAVEFPAFRDGRGFSTARLARERYHYKGEMRATGDVLQDLLFYMLRCGFDSFTLKSNEPDQAFAQASKSFHHVYQPTGDGRRTIIQVRQEKSK